MVAAKKSVSRDRFPTWMDQTASAMVRLLVRSTTVLMTARVTFRCWLAASNASWATTRT